MANPAEQSDTDAALFRQVLIDVTPLPETTRRPSSPAAPLRPRHAEHAPTTVVDRLSDAGASEQVTTEFTRNGFVNRRAILSRLVVETASNSFHLSM